MFFSVSVGIEIDCIDASLLSGAPPGVPGIRT